MEYSEALAEKIEARITELKSEIDAHERALAALRGRQNAGAGNGTASAGNGTASAGNAAASRGRRAASRPAGDRRPRRSRTASAEAVFDALKDGQDQASVIAKQFGVSPVVVRNRLQQLEEAGRISRSGNRRSTRWRSHAA
jgi:predicted Rossmann fold nucleotide-binding protein DprA/Smf involved in DNA uptake